MIYTKKGRFLFLFVYFFLLLTCHTTIPKPIINTGKTNIIVFIIELLIIALVIIVFKFPIELIIDFGPKLFNFITDSKVLGLMLNIWTLIFNIVYTIGGIYAYIKICEVRFANLSKRK